MEGLTCPSNPPEIPGQPWLSYVGNAGWAFTDTDRRGNDDAEYAANGIFFDYNKNPNIGPADGREAASPGSDVDGASCRRHHEDADDF